MTSAAGATTGKPRRPARPNARRRARHAALQALYQWQLTGQSPREVTAQFEADERHALMDATLFEELVRGVAREAGALDAMLEPLLDRPAEQLDPVERAILRLGAYELSRMPDVPFAVTLSEAVELAHTFGAEMSHRYVNGVLDPLARRLRPAETQGRR